MSERTSINVDKESHIEASDVKDEYGETWPEVLRWYAEHRPQENGEQKLSDEILAALNESERQINAGDTISLEELSEKLTRIESSVKEATNAAQSANRKLEDLGK